VGFIMNDVGQRINEYNSVAACGRAQRQADLPHQYQRGEFRVFVMGQPSHTWVLVLRSLMPTTIGTAVRLACR